MLFRTGIVVFALSLGVSSCGILNSNTTAENGMEDDMPVVEEMAIADTTGGAQDSIPKRKRLPTLREQMQRIEEHQAVMQKDIEFIKNDIAVLKDEVVQLRSTLVDGKPSVLKTDAVRGAVPQDAQTKEKEDGEPASATVLLSDEAEAAQQPKNTQPVKPTQTKQGTAKPPAAKGENTTPPKKPAQTTLLPDEQVNAAPQKPVTKKEEEAKPSDRYKEAMQYVAKKEYGKAVPLLEQVLDKENNPITRGNALYWLGEAAYANNEYDKAIEQFQKAFQIKSSTKADDALLMMAESYRKLGKNDDAKKAYERLLRLYPQSEFVARAKKMLQML